MSRHRHTGGTFSGDPGRLKVSRDSKLLVATHLESGLGLDQPDHGIRQRLVKLRGQGEVNNCV